MEPNPIIAEIRRVREQLMEDANNDPAQLAENARRTAQQYGFKAITREQLAELRAHGRLSSDVAPLKSKSA